MEVNSMQKLAIDVFKTLKSLNPDFMHTYFKVRTLQRKKIDLVVYRAKTVTLGEKSLRSFRPKIWNSLPEDVKDFASLPKFTSFIKHGTDLIAIATSANTRVTKITTLELHTLA